MISPSNYIDESQFSEIEIQILAQSLIAKHGDQAYEMASFFHDEYLLQEDFERADGYVNVMLYLIYEYGIGAKNSLST